MRGALCPTLIGFPVLSGGWELWTAPAPEPIVTGGLFICHPQFALNTPSFDIFFQSAGHVGYRQTR